MIERVKSTVEGMDDSFVSRLLRSASFGSRDGSSAVPSTVSSDDIENPVQQSSRPSTYIAQTGKA